MAWTTPRDWTDGELVTEALLDTHVRDNLKALTEWTSYTPTWAAFSGTPTIGNGTLTGAYICAGNLCHFWIRLVLGSTTSVGTSTGWSWTLPVPVAAGGYSVVSVMAFDAGLTFYTGAHLLNPTDTLIGAVSDAAGFGWGYNSPFTFGTGDSITASGTYPC